MNIVLKTIALVNAPPYFFLEVRSTRETGLDAIFITF